MKMISLSLALVLLVTLTSCVVHYFSEPIPYNAEEYYSMPGEILGVWTAEDETHRIDQRNWVSQKVDSTGVKITKFEYQLTDSLIVKRSNDHYFFSSLERNGYWTVYLGVKKEDYFFIQGLGSSDTLTFKRVLGIKPDSISLEKELFYNQRFNVTQMNDFVKNGGFSDTLFVFDLHNRTLSSEIKKNSFP